ncbi:uncharacterized protein BCR38DRAFT_413602 [Pseudomassariella vexata]|uniref:Uncharacterized protein n=1 Tax=Pseudomassariella vexata TaxID=1141098 RepID=A0A1Y2DG82_9PEZI|nr:uncharacterized protein BCR38DRAFT_413602 [Pseudomassariella vexata]ORY58207.1 hypothetical protein BCR38DRAFT_413602 [Pseudomassariella vexata]
MIQGPNDKRWPSNVSWATFNLLLRDRLIKTNPIAEPCYPGADFNSADYEYQPQQVLDTISWDGQMDMVAWKSGFGTTGTALTSNLLTHLPTSRTGNGVLSTSMRPGNGEANNAIVVGGGAGSRRATGGCHLGVVMVQRPAIMVLVQTSSLKLSCFSLMGVLPLPATVRARIFAGLCVVSGQATVSYSAQLFKRTQRRHDYYTPPYQCALFKHPEFQQLAPARRRGSFAGYAYWFQNLPTVLVAHATSGYTHWLLDNLGKNQAEAEAAFAPIRADLQAKFNTTLFIGDSYASYTGYWSFWSLRSDRRHLYVDFAPYRSKLRV